MIPDGRANSKLNKSCKYANPVGNVDNGYYRTCLSLEHNKKRWSTDSSFKQKWHCWLPSQPLIRKLSLIIIPSLCTNHIKTLIVGGIFKVRHYILYYFSVINNLMLLFCQKVCHVLVRSMICFFLFHCCIVFVEDIVLFLSKMLMHAACCSFMSSPLLTSYLSNR